MDYLKGKVAIVIGEADETHRGVAVALAEAGADIAIAGWAADLEREARMHSIANEIWALGKRSVVIKLSDTGDTGEPFPGAIERAQGELGRADMVVRAGTVMNA